MLEALLAVLCTALVTSLVYQYRSKKDTNKQLQEYRDLFELADASQKEAQGKVETLLQDIARKDLLMDRSAQALEEDAREIVRLKSQVTFQEEQYAKLLNQKKSSEVRTGKITEQIAPFLQDYPLDPQTARFIGDPIDFVHFDENKVTFVEVKSGKSQLNKRQREIRDLINEGKVEFIIYRVEGK